MLFLSASCHEHHAPWNTINFVLLSFVIMPCDSQHSSNMYSFSIRRSLEVARITVSSMSISAWSHLRNPSGAHLSFSIRMRTFTYYMKRKHDVGEPWRTPTIAVMTAIPRILFMILNIAMRANSIAQPHTSRFRISISLFLGTRSYAFDKSIYAIYNCNFFLKQ